MAHILYDLTHIFNLNIHIQIVCKGNCIDSLKPDYGISVKVSFTMLATIPYYIYCVSVLQHSYFMIATMGLCICDTN